MLLMNWVYNNIPLFFEDLFIDLVVSIIINYLLRLLSLSHEWKPNHPRLGQVILWIVKVRSWLHLWKPKGFRCRLSINYPARYILNILSYVILEASSQHVQPIQHHEHSTSFLPPCHFLYIEIVLSEDWPQIRLKKPIQLKRDRLPVDHFQALSHFLLLPFGDELGVFCDFLPE